MSSFPRKTVLYLILAAASWGLGTVISKRAIGEIPPLTLRVLADAGIDWSSATSTSVVEFLGRPFDYVITVCDNARQTCPIFPGVHESRHWDLEDPAEVEGSEADKLAAFQQTHAGLLERIEPFVAEARQAVGRSGPAPVRG